MSLQWLVKLAKAGASTSIKNQTTLSKLNSENTCGKL